MNIAVNTRLLIKDKFEGIGWFALENLKRITRKHKEHQFIFLFDRPFSEEFIFSDNIIPVVIPPAARHPFLWYLWFEYSVTYALKKHKADFFLSPDGWLSLKTPVKSLPVIHDLNFEHYPEFIPFIPRKYYHHYFPLFAAKAHRIATVSEFTKKDIVEKYHVDPEKIDVVYNGANEMYRPLNEEEKEKTRFEFSQGCPYFLFIGLIHPRKNLSNLFAAFEKFKHSFAGNTKLVVVGDKKWWTEDIESAFNKMNYQQDIIFLGRVPPEALKRIIGSALAMTYVSFFEGFGIPILEAMYCDVPVITSDCSSMPEVAGNAGILVDPFSPDSIKDALCKIASDADLRLQLIELGRTQRTNFSWDKTSDRLWDSIQKSLDTK